MFQNMTPWTLPAGGKWQSRVMNDIGRHGNDIVRKPTFAGQRPIYWGFGMKWVFAGARSEPIKATILENRHIFRNGTINGDQGSNTSPKIRIFA